MARGSRLMCGVSTAKCRSGACDTGVAGRIAEPVARTGFEGCQLATSHASFSHDDQYRKR